MDKVKNLADYRAAVEKANATYWGSWDAQDAVEEIARQIEEAANATILRVAGVRIREWFGRTELELDHDSPIKQAIKEAAALVSVSVIDHIEREPIVLTEAEQKGIAKAYRAAFIERLREDAADVARRDADEAFDAVTANIRTEEK
jgi:hypothetical protein